MTNLEKRQAERASMLYHYRAYEKAGEVTASDGSLVVIYTRPELAPKCFLLAFSGTAGKTTAHYSYRTVEQAERYAADFLAGRHSHRARVEERRAERQAFRTSLKPGAVLVNTWGYDQTNVDYYQVTAVSDAGRTVTIRPIAARSHEDGFMQGTCWPLADHFTGGPMTKRVGPGDSVKVRDFGSWARPWTPGLNRWTAYA
jgi:hypothetical protein